MSLRKFLVTLTIALVILLAVAIWFIPLEEDFRTENPLWNGARVLSSSHAVAPVKSLADLPLSPQGSTLILIPYLSYTAPELEKLETFVTQGGTLILADDYGYGNQVLEHFNLKTRFSGQALLDPLCNYKNKWFPRIVNLKASPLTSDTDNLVFNHATSLINVAADDALALSSRFSFLDQNGNQLWDENEPAGPLPVISRHSLGEGQLILISDPSIFINSMATIESNRRFIQNIAASTTASLLIDQSHLPPSELHQNKDALAQIRGLLATPAGTLVVIMLALSLTMMPVWYRRASKL